MKPSLPQLPPAMDRVVVVEDDRGLRHLIQRALEREGLLVTVADDGPSAISAMSADAGTLVLLDHHLPGMSGREVIEALVGHGSVPPFIIMTGNGDEPLAVDMMKSGARDYVVKNQSFLERLPAIVRRVLRELDQEWRLRDAEREREVLILELQDALNRIRTLSGMLPICASCKKIRDDQGYWEQVETYIMKHTDAQFSHGICPECARTLYPEYFPPLDKGELPR